ncbi:MAG: hypothetical protein M1838_004307 [Thelocarpon superellum]|nr:MAG: hypothetical protein M1838_004307 [Thelocarpon superellum]
MAADGLPSVRSMTTELYELLQLARQVKPHDDIEPPLALSDFGGRVEQLGRAGADGRVDVASTPATPQAQYAIIETSVRGIFNELLASTPIDDPRFTQVPLPAPVNISQLNKALTRAEQCEPGLIFWLIEELLDSQTIGGCRKVFDYLESRRERITAKHFQKKNLIILRCCNELLRRLSRAENTVFCGRVFIFLFQSFPLGDKSSVNLRGEFHVENTTSFDYVTPMPVAPDEQMDIDEAKSATPSGPSGANMESTDATRKEISGLSSREAYEAVPATKEQGTTSNLVDMDVLYPAFWPLQQAFSNPTKLFEGDHFDMFKEGLNLTIRKFSQVQKDIDGRAPIKALDEGSRGAKRKRGDGDEEFASGFNAKYLTSRDLFELEISDLAFRRHILVQALILLDFLLSLTPKAKARVEELNLQNRSVHFHYSLTEEQSKWAADTRSTIANYLQEGPEGKFYYRMVDTVLSRDKNWVRWKAENCPPIERPAISAQALIDARTAAHKACATRRLRATPLGSLDLSFLTDAETANGLDELKAPTRYAVPDPKSFEGDIAEDEFDINMAKSEEEKEISTSAKASKTWRALRVASKSRLNLFDQVTEHGQNVKALFATDREDGEAPEPESGADEAEAGGAPEDGSHEAPTPSRTGPPPLSATPAPATTPATGDESVM